MRTRRQPGRCGGATLLEVLIAVTLLSGVFVSAATLASRGSTAYRVTAAAASLEERLQRALQRVAEELEGMGAGLAFPDPSGEFGTRELSFQCPAGLDAGDVVWGPLQRIAFEYSPGETDDGTDNNGDGSVDEGQLVLVRNVGQPEEMRVVLCRGVSELLEGELLNAQDDNGNGVRDEAGFNVHLEQGVLTLRLTLERDLGGELVRRTGQRSLRLRN